MLCRYFNRHLIVEEGVSSQKSPREIKTKMNQDKIRLYQTPDGGINLEARLENETIWLNRQQMSELFGRGIKTIGKHINNALKEELSGISTVANFATVQKEGDRNVVRDIEYCNLDMIISVGYRVKSNRGIQFRVWANKIVKEYLIKGYVVNEKIKSQQYADLRQTVKLLSNVLQAKIYPQMKQPACCK